jgi:hypothetical protein
MSTTDLFVELIIIGIGAAIWLVLLILSLFGYNWVPLGVATSLVALVPALAVVYVLGIVVDRVADALFEKVWKPALYRKVYDDKQAYFHDRHLIYIHAERLSNLLEYGRSRLRICRGWTLNAFLILITSNLFVWTRLSHTRRQVVLSVCCTAAIGLFAYGNWFAWRQLALTNYRKVQDQSAYLRDLGLADTKAREN